MFAQPACRSISPASRASTAAAKTSSAPWHMEMMYDSMTSGPKVSSALRTVLKTPSVLAPAASRGAGRRGERAAGAQLLGQQPLPVVAGHVDVAPGLLAEPVEELPERVVVGVGVLAYVHGGELEPEGGDGAEHPLQAAVGDEFAAVLAQRRLEQRQVVEEFGGAEVVAAGGVRGVGGEPVTGVEQLLPDAGGLEPVGLLAR